jgi:pimeloyl-ACP methyl ester carboxylesterase
MVNGTSGTVEVDGGKLFYETAGQGETLVLVHAGFVDSRMWDEQWEAFSQHFRVVRFDMLGFGRSDPATGPAARRRELQSVLEQLGVERAVLLGCSLGGGACIDLALEHPELVSALIPVSSVPGGFELQGEPPRYLFEMMGAVQQGDLDRASELQIRIWVDGIYREPEQVDADVRQRAKEMNRIALERGTMVVADAQPRAPLDPPAVGRLGKIAAPALVIAGTLDHPEILRAADVMAAAIPGAQKVVISGGAHLPNMDNPAAFNRAVLDFLHRLGDSKDR